MTLRPSLLAAAIVCALASGCGSGASPAETVATAGTAAAPTTVAPQPLTTQQASVFANVLTKNRRAGGATFSALIPFGPAATFNLDGEIDWVNYDASAVLKVTRSDQVAVPDQPMTWSKGQLYQSVEGLPAAMAQRGRTGVTLLQRPLDAKAAPIDRVIILINSMANARPENPILLRQRTDVAFVGTGNVGNLAVDRYRYGATTYSIGPDGTLEQVEANFSGFAAPVEVTFRDKGPKTITLPAADTWVAASEIPDVLAALNPKNQPAAQPAPQAVPSTG